MFLSGGTAIVYTFVGKKSRLQTWVSCLELRVVSWRDCMDIELQVLSGPEWMEIELQVLSGPDWMEIEPLSDAWKI